MKTFYHWLRLPVPAGSRELIALFMLTFTFNAYGQSLSVTLSVTNNAPDNCAERTLTASVSGGSGNYAYFWSSAPPSSVQLGNGPSITVSPGVATTYTVAVQDRTSGQYVQEAVLVSPLLKGGFNKFIPNAFFEGNLWRVLDGDKSTGPLNAFRYELSIIDDWGTVVYSSSRRDSGIGSSGLAGGEISWNGRRYGTGSYVAAGNYFYSLRLVNCSSNQLFQGTITFFREAGFEISLFPNPADTYVQIAVAGTEEEKEETTLPAPLEIKAISSEGEMVFTHQLTTLPARLDLKNLPQGTYSLRIESSNFVFQKRLYIRR